MRVHKCILAALVLAAAMTYGITAMAADFPKEGTYSGTYTGVGTVKATAIGTDRLLVAFDVTGVLLSNGFTEHMTLHCWGTSDFTKGVGGAKPFPCVGLDQAGDQLVMNCGAQKEHPLDQKSFLGDCLLSTGTGRYSGVSGNITYTTHEDAFRPPAEGTFVLYNTYQGSYKLP